jgi:hypothetical protein
LLTRNQIVFTWDWMDLNTWLFHFMIL